jgi:hypothetical protein
MVKGDNDMFRTDEWLPIGSVVHVKDSNRLLMVAGTMQVDQETGLLWDYMGYPFPEGNMKPGQDVMFDKDGIDGVYFLGYQPAEGLDYIQFLEKNEPEYRKAKELAASGDGGAGVDGGDVGGQGVDVPAAGV